MEKSMWSRKEKLVATCGYCHYDVKFIIATRNKEHLITVLKFLGLKTWNADKSTRIQIAPAAKARTEKKGKKKK